MSFIHKKILILFSVLLLIKLQNIVPDNTTRHIREPEDKLDHAPAWIQKGDMFTDAARYLTVNRINTTNSFEKDTTLSYRISLSDKQLSGRHINRDLESY